MEFCPTCGNLLLYELPHMDRQARFFCPTCPYVCEIESKVKIKRHLRLNKKKMDSEITDGKNETLPTTKVRCDKCGHGEATFEQKQIRSADEPMTIFYKCKGCGHIWKED